MAVKRGLFIVVYGPSGVGKSKELELLEEKFEALHMPVKRVEYPLYELKPTGPELKRVVWGPSSANPLSPKATEGHGASEGQAMDEEKLQQLFSQNRRDNEENLKSWLNAGISVLAEDYKGTGMVWGAVRGVDAKKLEEINKGFLEPDISILIDGPRRLDLRPGEGHIYNTNEEEWYRARKMYLQMADKYGWVRVGADAPILTVAGRIWSVVKPVVAVGGR